ncbi:MAG: 4-alpha-glucanotransferase [Gammaproteobacteria bacterium]|nr:4-alpha-glucanotransferase [Gammaproteobacteria bacterium]MDH4312570.1 4-alpha-glucanotransferase [Gammaproteobacteria bacterium]MDH5272007.1 4-alpha-glucanotransferase [Gammaproteobacteria bacterium]
MLDSLLDQLARQRGIGDAYHNYRGELLQISRETKTAILAAMGLSTSDAATIERELHERETGRLRSLLPSVAVMHPHRNGVTVAVPADSLERELAWRIATDGGDEVQGRARAADLPEQERREVDGRWQTRRVLPLPGDLRHGYHTLHVVLDGLASESCALIVAPLSCHEPAVLRDGGRLWGVAVQLYTLRSGRNWGIGDFADLAAVVRTCAEQGGAFVGLNPLHALFPGNPWQFSPYSPSSRLFLNVLYIAIEGVAEFAHCAEAQAMVHAAEFQAELARLRAAPCVDYPGVTQAKLRVLKLLHAHFRRDQSARTLLRAAQFQAYRAERGESLRRHALHDAIDEHMRSIDGHRYWGWPMWPEELRDPTHPGVQAFEKSHAESVEFHAWLQWLADEQLGEAQALGRKLGMPIGLYGDYAVGVNPSGSETWSDQALYRKGAGVGAPPDALALMGQDWGIPPQDPNVLVAEQYRPFRNLVAANMRHFGALRLDHVMALFRQWWVPFGLGSTAGGYVHYPLDDLLSVLALESERHACLVVGEDLGTVPPEMSRAMDDRAVYSYRVLLFEKNTDGSFIAPGEYPRRAIATVTTHDLPTLRGYWSGCDIDLRQRLSLYPNEETRQQVADERVRDRHGLLAALEAEGLKPDDASDAPDAYTEALSHAIHVFLARTASALVVLQAEDLIGMPDPVNVPGTNEEHANWQRKMACPIDEIFGRDPVRELLSDVHSARTGDLVRINA